MVVLQKSGKEMISLAAGELPSTDHPDGVGVFPCFSASPAAATAVH
jgi:hypothetical protein